MTSSVVVLPQPLGPRSVTNSLSRTWRLMPSKTRRSPWLATTSWRRISGNVRSPEGTSGGGEHGANDDDLDEGQAGHLAGEALLPSVEHGDAQDLGSRLLQEHHGGV